MSVVFQLNGNLPQGIHLYTLAQLKVDFGFTNKRRDLIKGLEELIVDLKDCNCKTLYIDGSFASNCDYPNDYDCCFDPEGIDWEKMFREYPIFFDSSPGRKLQKLKYKGEIFSSTRIAAPPKILFLEFFQKDKNDNSPKGIIQLNL